MITMDLFFIPFSLIVLSSAFIINCYGDTTVSQSTTLETTLTTHEATLTTHKTTLTTPEEMLDTTQEQITENTTVSSAIKRPTLKDDRPDYIWIAYVVVLTLLLPLVGVFVVNYIRGVRRDKKQEKEHNSPYGDL
ncbi:Hypothetical predicted protein [Mytilus galloprovincialis]|uniref:Uncharacterized protein n=2 Tax=Mytilus galloprovincialis TaxID=29158 RepID=A0A8B6DTT8_MYTGA|nr:Hypothetical predicted protein [Mytilus galloprovincialis]